MFLYPFARKSHWDQRSGYQANILNLYQQRTVSPVAELLGQSDPRANLTARATDSEGNQLHATLEREGENFRVATQVENRKGNTDTNFEVDASLQDEATNRTATKTTPQTPVRYEYDADGNLVSDESWHYEWNGENRLVRMYSREVVAPESRKQLDFAYDANGRRIEKIVSHWDKKSHQVTFAYDGWNMIGELQVQGKDSDWKTYLWGLDLSQGTQGAGGVGGLLTINGLSEADNRKKKDKPSSFLPFYDGNGNVMGLLSAEVVEQVASYVYSPFGKLLAAIEVTNVNAYKFSTKYADDETELCYYGYRYLSPTIGRWINRDPIQEEGGVNLNGFVYNDSINGLDAHGKNLVRAIVSAGAAIATAVRAAAKACRRLSCKTAKHGPHHFWVKGGKTCWMKHVQVDCWFKGRRKSTFNLARFEYGPCYKFKHGVGGITH